MHMQAVLRSPQGCDKADFIRLLTTKSDAKRTSCFTTVRRDQPGHGAVFPDFIRTQFYQNN